MLRKKFKSAFTYWQSLNAFFHKMKFPKSFKNPMIKYMVKYCMLKTRAVTAPSVAEQILMYSDGQTYVTECVLRSAYLFCASVCPRCVLWYCSSLRQGFQDGIHLLSYCCQRKFKLVLIRRSKSKRGGEKT